MELVISLRNGWGECVHVEWDVVAWAVGRRGHAGEVEGSRVLGQGQEEDRSQQPSTGP